LNKPPLAKFIIHVICKFDFFPLYKRNIYLDSAIFYDDDGDDDDGGGVSSYSL
jgi:hypothetical protein